MIKLKLPILKETIQPIKSINALDFSCVDQQISSLCTNALFETITQDETTKYLLAELIGCIESWVYLGINIKLINDGHLPLIGIEDFKFILTGDSVLNLYFENNFLGQSLREGSNLNSEIFKQYFKINGFDINILIKSNDTNRYELIEKFAIESLVHILSTISTHFDLLFDFGSDPEILNEKFYDRYPSNDLSTTMNYKNKKLAAIKSKLSYSNISYIFELLTNQNIPENILKKKRPNNSLQLIDLEEYATYFDDTSDIMIFPYFYLFNKKNYYKNAADIKPIHFEEKIANNISRIFRILATQNIYGDANKKHFLQGLSTKLNYLVDKEFYTKLPGIILTGNENTQPDFFTSNKILSADPNDIAILNNQSTYTYNTPKGIVHETIMGIMLRKHLLMVNQVESSTSKGNSFFTDVDTVNFRLNVVLKKSMGVGTYPADFFRFKIIRPNDSLYESIADSTQIRTLRIVGDGISTIEAYTSNFIIAEMFRTIFDNNHFFPWMKKSMIVDLTKALFITSMSNYNDIIFISEMLVSVREKQSFNFKYKFFHNQNYAKYSFYDMVWIDSMVLKEHSAIEYLIRFIVIMENLLRLDRKKMNEIIITFNQSYGWEGIEEGISITLQLYFNFTYDIEEIIKNLNE